MVALVWEQVCASAAVAMGGECWREEKQSFCVDLVIRVEGEGVVLFPSPIPEQRVDEGKGLPSEFVIQEAPLLHSIARRE
jgi:hypothetical protein